MSQKELQRIKVVDNAVSGRLKVSEAAELLQLSERQVTRLKGRVTSEAVDWVYHGNRGCHEGRRSTGREGTGGSRKA